MCILLNFSYLYLVCNLDCTKYRIEYFLIYFYEILVIFFMVLWFQINIRIQHADNEYRLREKENKKKSKKKERYKNKLKNKKVKRIRKSMISKEIYDETINEYSCSSCNKIYFNPRTLKSHQSNDCRRIYTCKWCKATYHYRASFCRHRKICSSCP